MAAFRLRLQADFRRKGSVSAQRDLREGWAEGTGTADRRGKGMWRPIEEPPANNGLPHSANPVVKMRDWHDYL